MFSFKKQPLPTKDYLAYALKDLRKTKNERPNLEARMHAATRDYPSFAALLEALNAVDSVKVLLSECSLPCIRLNQDPRIRFEAEVEFAKALRKEVLADARREQPVLYAPWDILVAKEDVLRTVFELSCAEYLEESKRYYRHREHYAALGLFRPENLVNDFAALTEMVNAVAAQVCQRKSAGIMPDDSKKEE